MCACVHVRVCARGYIANASGVLLRHAYHGHIMITSCSHGHIMLTSSSHQAHFMLGYLLILEGTGEYGGDGDDLIAVLDPQSGLSGGGGCPAAGDGVEGTH